MVLKEITINQINLLVRKLEKWIIKIVKKKIYKQYEKFKWITN